MRTLKLAAITTLLIFFVLATISILNADIASYTYRFADAMDIGHRCGFHLGCILGWMGLLSAIAGAWFSAILAFPFWEDAIDDVMYR